MSHPSRVRGLKLSLAASNLCHFQVAPLTGAWIETCQCVTLNYINSVAPLTGAWIETKGFTNPKKLPLVAPLTGAWIETFNVLQGFRLLLCRTPHGCVD